MSSSAEGDGCTGFQWLEAHFPIRACCDVHDAGGSDGTLLDCLAAATPDWALPIVVLCVFLMVVFRPLYQWLKARAK
ncbi:hypothetical protein GCM10007913_11850 [Devosia yakushimensis]|uniref:Uncharacterized protein n=1 Tax=Devosia yakushimensis TaxID=470028 RepID=A0ABQ5UC95_9HYPH|nr:hypothetical protein [Devosia yakushimensis]GLQ09253.1 hypothetical protein GCM10007913_11850 [Devosia yakushimensis]